MKDKLNSLISTARYLNAIFLFINLIFAPGIVIYAQEHYERYNAIDVQDYKFKLVLSDSSNEIKGKAEITIKFKKPVEQFVLDLTSLNKEKTGMSISSMLENGNIIIYKHVDDKITIRPTSSFAGEIRTYTIEYHGIPANGLFISKNRYGDRTFFGDNWPDRAHNWLPTVDHPSDKALVEFTVIAPSYYQVIANGRLLEETDLNNDFRITRWKTDVVLPTKLMVIGVARFSVHYTDIYNNIQVSSWVYPQDSKSGPEDFQITIPALEFFSTHVGPYPFEKLANVQSKTIYGGTENASNIFYNERLINSERDISPVVVHEIAHQWFGDAASELNWHHVWLSEGFATYMTDLFYENYSGREIFVERMKDEREQVIRYSKRRPSIVIDTTITDYMHGGLLSPITYEKAGWFLHMLRHRIGDENFWACIQDYYGRFTYGNALTEDFQNIVEKVSGEELGNFFHQWLYRPGHPVINIEWTYENNEVRVKIIQQQEGFLFNFPLDIALLCEDNTQEKRTIEINQAEQSFRITPAKKPLKILSDPDTWLLFEDVRGERK